MKRNYYFLYTLITFFFLCSCNKEYNEGRIDFNIPENLNVLWIGTSIPAGCSYPVNACNHIKAKCTNNSIGASFLSIYNMDDKGELYAGLSLTETIAEKEEKYRKLVNNKTISQATLDLFKKASFESNIIPIIKSTDIVVIDHGYNDDISLYKLYDNRTTINDNDTIWDSTDRNNFIGAFNFLYRKIKTENPNIKIIIGGYFQNNCTIGHAVRGKYVSYALTDISRHYGITCLDVWNYMNIPDGYKPHSEHHLDSINNVYGTKFSKWLPNEKGEITYFQKYCPDTVHPFSDPTNIANAKLDSIFSFLLPQKIKEL